MSRRTGTMRQLNVEIEAGLINRCKAQASLKGEKLYEYVEQALREKLKSSMEEIKK